jgi:hypothetical protein
VDDGTQGNFGTEIELRGQFEACACVVDRTDSERIAELMDPPGNDKDLVLGWEGVRREPRESQSDAEPGPAIGTEHGRPATGLDDNRPREQGGKPAKDGSEKSLAICLCFEGGPGTIGTVQVRPPHPSPARLVAAGPTASRGPDL